MLKPLKGGVSNFQVHDQDQGGAHPIEEKVGTLKNLSSPKSSCAHLMMKLPSSGSTVDLTGSTKSKWQKKCVSSQRQIISARMLADFPRSMYNGPVLPQGHLRSLSSQTSLWQSSFVAGSEQKANNAPNIVTPSSCSLLLQPLSWGHLPPGQPSVGSVLRHQAPMFLPSRQQNGSVLLQDGRVCLGPISLLPESCRPSCPFPSSLP